MISFACRTASGKTFSWGAVGNRLERRGEEVAARLSEPGGDASGDAVLGQILGDEYPVVLR